MCQAVALNLTTYTLPIYDAVAWHRISTLCDFA